MNLSTKSVKYRIAFLTTHIRIFELLSGILSFLQAFVHDPLINWRLFPQVSMFAGTHVLPVVNAEETNPNRELPQPQRGARERELLQVFKKFQTSKGRCFRKQMLDFGYLLF